MSKDTFRMIAADIASTDILTGVPMTQEHESDTRFTVFLILTIVIYRLSGVTFRVIEILLGKH